jgi:16S rRNA (guanine527-N7)-methyltransferase
LSRTGQGATDRGADKAAALRLTPVSRETLQRLEQFIDLLLLWQQKTNLVAPSTLPTIWTRHVADSLQLLAHAPDAKTWVDFGSGGGFPAIPIACALAGRPSVVVHLVESNGKKAAFLREAVRVTGAPARVHLQRAEIFAGGPVESVDAVTARALSPLKTLCDQACPWIAKGAIGLFPKGQDVEAELTEATNYWNIEASTVPSRTSPDGCIVVVRRLSAKQGTS